MLGESNRANLLEIQSGRVASYAFFSQVFREEMSLNLLRELAESLKIPHPQDSSSKGREMLKDFFDSLGGADLERTQKELAIEYASLFLNPGIHPVPLYESVYTSPNSLVMQTARDQVLDAYRKEGLSRSTHFNEPEDHLAIEMDFMSQLCRKGIEALSQGEQEAYIGCLAAQQEFVVQHLFVWAPVVFTNLEYAAKSKFYRAIACLASEFIGAEQEIVNALVLSEPTRSAMFGVHLTSRQTIISSTSAVRHYKWRAIGSPLSSRVSGVRRELAEDKQ